MMANDQAEWRKFRKWLFRHLKTIEAQNDFDYDKVATEKFSHLLDICLGDYEEKGIVNHEMAAFKWDYTIFMDEKEIEQLTEEQRPKAVKPPKMIDLEKAQRISHE